MVRTALLALGVALTVLTAQPAAGAQIWLSATEPIWRGIRGWPLNDYMDLFRPDAPWQHAVAQVMVFGVSKRFVLETPESDLVAIINALRRHNIKLSVQATPLFASRECGLGVEGHGPPNDMVMVATRLKLLGADMAYMTMDEPLFYGHRFKGSPGISACHTTVPEIARQVAAKMMAVRKIYPSVVIGDIEPMGVLPAEVQDWTHQIAEWIAAYRDAMGEPLGFFQADVVWQRPSWRDVLLATVSIARANRVPLGIIYNGMPTDATDAVWIDDAESHFRLVEGSMKISPDQAILQSWTDHPRSMLPESNRDALTNLVLRYSAWQSRRQ
jgi:hypothetical protein